MSVMIMSTELDLMGKLQRSQRTVSMGNPETLFDSIRNKLEFEIQHNMTASVFPHFLSPALVCPPLLDVAYVIDCAAHCHVIVVSSNVE